MSKLLGYVRVSRVGDRDETLISPKLQAEAIERWCESQGLEVEILPPELDASGGDDSRPILLEAVDRIERGEVQGLVVWRFDRFTRSLRHSLELLERIEGAGGQVRSVSEQLDPSTSAGRLTRNIMFSIAQNEREQRAEGITAAKADAIARGIYIAPVVPLGYRRREDRRLEPDPETAEIVREVFRRRASGTSYRVLADYVREQTGRSFLAASVRRLLANPAYLGVSRQGSIQNPKAHEPLIDRATFEAAQIHQPRPARGSTEALLRGLVFCTGCSMRMTTGLGRGGRRYYRCRKDHAAGRCPEPASIEAAVIEPYVTELVLGHLDRVSASAAESGPDLEELEARVDAAQAELDAFQEVTSVTDEGADYFAAGLRSRIDQLQAARQELAAARLATGGAIDPASVRELWPGLSVVEQRQVLGGAIGAIWIARGSGVERVAVLGPEQREDRPTRGGPARELVSVDLADLPGQIRPAST